MSYKVGDVVRLKSGGPKMTVAVAKANGQFECVWFTSDATAPWSFTFVEASVEPASAEESAGSGIPVEPAIH